MKNYSRQREVILETLRENAVHPTAEELFALVREKIPNISLATVYRNLKELSKDGTTLSIPGGLKEHFDGTTVKHAHFLCERCEKVRDVMLSDQTIADITNQCGGDFILIYKGVCPACQNQQEKN